MSNESKRAAPVELDEATAWQLLASHDIGHLARSAEPWPDVRPVVYTTGDGFIVCHALDTTGLDSAEAAQAATFEASGLQKATQSIWSVIVRGRLHAERAQSDDSPELAATGDQAERARLDVESISGHRIPAAQAIGQVKDNTWLGQDASDLIG